MLFLWTALAADIYPYSAWTDLRHVYTRLLSHLIQMHASAGACLVLLYRGGRIQLDLVPTVFPAFDVCLYIYIYIYIYSFTFTGLWDVRQARYSRCGMLANIVGR